MLTVSVLGPVELRRDGERLSLPAGKTTELLVRLALDAGVAVRPDRLIADLWDEDEDGRVGRNTLQAKVSTLRRALGDASTVSGGTAGYTLVVDPADVDALVVRRVAGDVAALLDAGDPRAVLAAVDTALSAFQGEVLPDAGDGTWLLPHRIRLEETRLTLMEHRISARMALGQSTEVVGELEALVAEHPLREGFWQQLVIALYRGGRQADALAAYHRVRDVLAEQLGLDPGPELRALEQRVLAQDSGLDGPVSAPDESAVPTPGPRGNLPGLSADLIGREADLSDLTELVATRRLVTVTGPAGVGKTRLAIEVARHSPRPDGRWLVRCDTARTADSLAQVVGAALAMPAATTDLIADRLASSRALLVLDNCEHLVDAIADLVDRLLEAAPGLTVLATSQLPLGRAGEEIHHLTPLSIADSVRLFERRATGRRSSFALDEAAAVTVEEVCRALDGLPLAIELAAARTVALSVQEIARRLDDRFALLTDPTSRTADRHRALDTAIAWSHDLLFPDDQRGLWALACFAGGATLDATEAVAAALDVPPTAVLDVVSRLVDRSLVVVDESPHGATRYRLLDSVRAFAAQRLAEAGLADQARAAHATWLAEAADRARADQHGPHLAEHVAVSVSEHANVDLALTWTAEHAPALGLRIAVGFGWTSVILGEGAPAAERLRRALAAAGDTAPAAERATALSLAAWDEAAADVQRAQADADAAVASADRVGDAEAIAASRFSLAFVYMQQGRAHDMLTVIDGWRAEAGGDAEPWNVGMSCALETYAALGLGDIDRIRSATTQAARLGPDLGDGWLTSQFEANFAHLAQAEGRYDDAAAHLRRAVDEATIVGLPATVAFHLGNLGRALHQAGATADAVAALEEAVETGQRVGNLRIVAMARVRLARVLRQVGQVDAARGALVAAGDWFRASGGGQEALLGQCLLAAIDARAGAPGAEAALALVLDQARAGADPEVEVLATDALAWIRASVGEPAAARRLLDDADARLAEVGPRLVDADRVDAQAARARLA